MPKPSEQAQIDFIVDCLRKGKSYDEIETDYSNIFNTITHPLLSIIEKANEAIKGDLATIDYKDSQSITHPISKHQRQVILSKIALGELEAEKLIVTADGIKKAKVKPSHSDMMNAITHLNRMDGSNAPTKIESIVKTVTSSQCKHVIAYDETKEQYSCINCGQIA